MSSKLICRKCKCEGEIVNQSLYRYKKILAVVCTNKDCKQTWHISVPRAWEPSWENKAVEPVTETPKAEERPKTAMELAFEKARKATEEFPY